MKIEAGKYYMTRDGRKVGPMTETGNNPWAWMCDGLTYRDDGGYCITGQIHPKDIIEEWSDTETGTLAELDVKPGDVVECVRWKGCMYKKGDIRIIEEGECYSTVGLWRIISRASDDTPKLWRDMSPEEKGALLLAAQEGKVIERWSSVGWIRALPVWYSGYEYRVKPEPVVDTVTMYASDKMKGFGLKRGPRSTYKITFNTIDGEPDVNSVKMVKIK